MKYFYEDLSPEQFEILVVFLCQHLLGVSVQGFATGPDGGRDAKFIGTAELHPSKTSPWMGITIIQAKHTNGFNKSFGEPDFYSKVGDNTVIGKEIPRIKKLIAKKELDNYMLFANRRLAGNSESDIRAHLVSSTGIDTSSVYLCGVEQLEVFFKRFPDVPKLADLDPVDSPLIVSPDDLAEVVQALANQRETIQAYIDDPPTVRISYSTKNIANAMTEAYATALRKRYLKETSQIRKFLAAPENLELLGLYESVADEFQLQIIAKRKDYQTFDEVMNYLAQLLFGRDVILRQNKRLTRVMLFYMYWNCDIGVTGDAETNQTFAS